MLALLFFRSTAVMFLRGIRVHRVARRRGRLLALEGLIYPAVYLAVLLTRLLSAAWRPHCDFSSNNGGSLRLALLYVTDF